MDGVVIQGFWKRNLWQTLAAGLLLACAYAFPPAAAPISLLLPLAVCPAYAAGKLWFALGLPFGVLLAGVLGGGPLPLMAILPVAPCLSLLAVSPRFHRQLSLGGQAIACSAAFLLAALSMIGYLSLRLGGPLFASLTETTVARLEGSAWSGNVLYRLVTFGFLPLPDAYRSTAALRLGDWILINPPLERELINMLRLRLSEGLSVWVPQLLMHGAAAVGLFTALGAERARVKRLDDQSAMPAFRTLRLTRPMQGGMLVLCLGTVLTSFSDLPLPSLICMLMYSAFAAVYQLLGAAVVVYLPATRHPRRVRLYGLLAVALYVLFPIALFLLGVADQFLNLRTASLNHQEEE